MFGRKKRSLDDFDSEIQAHLDLETEEFRQNGLDEREAHYAALRRFGNVTSARERFYESTRWLWFDAIVRDLRFACRVMRRQPGSTLAVIGILALAIGVTTAIFSIINALVLMPLPYRDIDRLVTFGYGGVSAQGSGLDQWEGFKQQATAFEDVAGYRQVEVNLLGAGEPMNLSVAEVTGNFLDVMGAVPRLGRLFSPEEEIIGNRRGYTSFNDSGRVYAPEEEKALSRIGAAMISERLWRSRFSASPDILEKSITLGGRPFTIVGVLPSGFDYPPGSEVWTPTFFFHSYFQTVSNMPSFSYWLARIRSDAPFAQAARQYHDILYREFKERPDFAPIIDRIVTETDQQMIGGVAVKHPFGIQPLRKTLSYGGRSAWFLFWATLLVMLIAVTNVTGLVMARMLFRSQEFAVRYALGAPRRSFFGMLLVEHTFLALAGGAAGILIAAVGIQCLKPLLPPDWPAYAAIGIDWRVLVFTLGVVAVVGLLAGLASALFLFQMRRAAGTLLPGERGGIPRRLVKWRAALIFVETALALTLLSSSGILLKDYLSRLNTPPGFNPENLLAISVSRNRNTAANHAKNQAFYTDVIDRLRAVSGVRSVSGANNMSLLPRTGRNTRTAFTVNDGTGPAGFTRDETTGQVRIDPNLSSVSVPLSIFPDFFTTMGYKIIAGRDFDNTDIASGPKVVIINEAMSRELRLNHQALGKSVSHSFNKNEHFIVGVVKSGSAPEIYFPDSQGSPFGGQMTFILRTSGQSSAIVQAARRAIFAADHSQSIAEMDWIANTIAWRLRGPRSLAALVSVFAFLGYALVLTGVYGIITHAANSRIREYGIRLALGAEPLRLWLKASVANLPPLLAGIAAGVGLSWYAVKIIRSEVPGIDPSILETSANLEMLGGVALLLLITATAAGAFASHCILRVDPITVLRHE